MSDYDFDRFKKDFFDAANAAANGVSSMAKEAASAARVAFDSAARYQDFNDVGGDMFASGLVTSHAGNLSLCDGRKIWVTHTGAQLGHLQSSLVLEVEWEASEVDEGASIELKVHRAMYHALAERLAGTGEAFGWRAIAHAHSLYSNFLSLQWDKIVPLDSEGQLVLGESVPVISPQQTVASDEVAWLMSEIVKQGGNLAVVRGHGPFAIAESLPQAYRLLSCLEYSAHLLTLQAMVGRGRE